MQKLSFVDVFWNLKKLQDKTKLYYVLEFTIWKFVYSFFTILFKIIMSRVDWAILRKYFGMMIKQIAILGKLAHLIRDMLIRLTCSDVFFWCLLMFPGSPESDTRNEKEASVQLKTSVQPQTPTISTTQLSLDTTEICTCSSCSNSHGSNVKWSERFGIKCNKIFFLILFIFYKPN